MDGLLSRSGLRTNYIHLTAICTAAAHIWTAAQSSPSFGGHADVSERLKALFRRCLQSLQALLTEVDAQGISNVLWSSATLGFNPDDGVPGLVHALTSRFLYFIDMEGEEQQPKAQEAANVLWAFEAMGYPAATAQVVGRICFHFGRLTVHQDARQRPKAQECANVLSAIAKMRHSSATATTEMVDFVCLHFMRLVRGPSAQQRPTAQEVANLVWALGTLEHTPHDDRVLDQLCDYMRELLCSHDPRSHPNAQNIANTVWALAQLKHAPSNGVVTAMFDCLVASCHSPGLKPDSQNISNSFLACAELGLDVKPTCIEALLKHFREMPVLDVNYQDCCNLIWSLAVMHCLDLNIFEGLLVKLATKHTLSSRESGPQSTSAQLITSGIRQLHQALAWLKPHSGSKQFKAWSSLRSRLLTVAPEPAVRKVSLPGQAVMWAALAMHDVPYQVQVQQGVHRAHALLSPHDKGVAKVILMVDSPRDHLINLPNRVLGSAAFRTRLLARYGNVVTIPYNPDSSTAESMAVDIKAAVEAKTGLPLDSFHS